MGKTTTRIQSQSKRRAQARAVNSILKSFNTEDDNVVVDDFQFQTIGQPEGLNMQLDQNIDSQTFLDNTKLRGLTINQEDLPSKKAIDESKENEFYKELKEVYDGLQPGQKVVVYFPSTKTSRDGEYVLGQGPTLKESLGSDPSHDTLIYDEIANYYSGSGAKPEIRVVTTKKKKEGKGKFFDGLLTKEAEEGLKLCGIDLQPHQIFSYSSFIKTVKEDPIHLTTHCLLNTVKEYYKENESKIDGGIHVQLLDYLNGKVKIRNLKQLAELINVNIKLVQLDSNNDWQYRSYTSSPKSESSNLPILNLGLLRGHYFLNKELEPKTGDLLMNLHRIIRMKVLGTEEQAVEGRKDGSFRHRGVSKIRLSAMLALLDRFGYIQDFNSSPEGKDLIACDLVPRCGDELIVKQTQSEGSKRVFINDMYIPDPNEMPEVKASLKKKRSMSSKLSENGCVWYADYETTSGPAKEQVPYMLCAIKRGGGEELTSHNWANLQKYGRPGYSDTRITKTILAQMSKSVKDKEGATLLIYFHNLAFDSKFMIPSLTKIKTIEHGSRVYEVRGVYKPFGWKNGIKIVLRDSYSYLQCPLAAFSSQFKIVDKDGNKLGKQKDFPYHKYTMRRLTEFNGKLIENGVEHNMYSYARKYCITDCSVLQQGFDQFRDSANRIELDVDDYLTAASFASGYMKKMGCLEGVEPLTGAVMRYVQMSVVGGRVCVKGNKPFYTSEVGTAVDANSLYPSAMVSMPGFPTGKPIRFYNNPSGNGYYVATVRVVSIGKELNFSTLSKVVNGKRMWGKNIVKPGDVLILNDQQIEDAIEHQEVEFEFIGGLQWEGYNTKICEVIHNLFNWRLELKKEKNPLQLIVKLIMNSCYGKLIEREHTSVVKYFRSTDEEAIETALNSGTGYDYLMEVSNDGIPLWKLRYSKIDYDHCNYSHCGSMILAHSKKIMYKLTTPLDASSWYTDTDSVYVPLIKFNEFLKKYPELIGNNLGQFHSDLSWRGDSGGDLSTCEFMALGKKVYYNAIVNSKYPGAIQYNFRLKGVPKDCVEYYMEQSGINVPDLFREIKNNGVEFNLLATKARFRLNGVAVVKVDKFTRVEGPFIDYTDDPEDE